MKEATEDSRSSTDLRTETERKKEKEKGGWPTGAHWELNRPI